ncbi:hypothetical protein BFP72_03780 [Reichenbachiella sp. 5M10]|uniref:alpha/beta hydrolase n=1 Tax=Reichenbachiella sp. 5M10 TaxID=1889772 RepID=UPI000C156957|nr:alpha/beta hydrolase [Reichenbachiella sp. 5M10]PIB34591.1 hypothetical protein BFP72_03780 [Reichenbachiella sp. 5M10]
MKVYGIGGLGVDNRVFAELNLDFELTPLEWIVPLHKESLESYTRRFAEQIDRNTPFSIVGVSFGGMMAIELNKILDPVQIVLLSSATRREDIPRSFRIAGQSGLLRVIPKPMMKPPAFVNNWFFGVSDAKYKALLQDVVDDTDTDFLRWAIGVILQWNNHQSPSNLLRVHGTADRILRCTTPDEAILLQGAGHFMVMDRSEEVSRILNQSVKRAE